MAFVSASFSNRKLQNRRFTADYTATSVEAFTDTLDLSAGEIFTDDGLIPTGSGQLPFSGSDQNGLIVSASVVDPNTYPEGSSDDLPILKYHYRKKLTVGTNAARDTFYFLTSDPATATTPVGSDQIIEDDQQTNFISPKYISAVDAANSTETSTTPGYEVVVSAGTTAGGATAINKSKYVFDYKTGIVSFIDTSDVGASDFVFISAYQYVGRTLRSQIDDGTIGGSGFPFSGSAVITGSLTVSASKVDFTNATAISGSTFSGSFVGDGSGLTGLSADSVAYDNITGKPALISGSTFSSPSQGTLRATINGVDSDIDLGLQTSDNVQFTNLTLSGDLTVNGTTTTVNSTEVELGDRILVLNAALAGGSGNAGINVHVSASDGDPLAHTGSFLWDDDEQYWKGGVLGSEVKFLRETGDGIFSGSEQVNADSITNFDSNVLTYINTLGIFSGSEQVNADSITNFDSNILTYINTLGVFSGSAQVDLSGFSTTDLSEGSNLYYTDARVKTKLNTEGVISGSDQVNADSITNFDSNVLTYINTLGIFSGSEQVNADSITNFDSNVLTYVNTLGIFSGSEQVNADSITNFDSNVLTYINTLGIFSGSSQVNADSILNFDTNVVAGLPEGTVSGSSQIVLENADKTGFTGASTITTLGTVTAGDVSAILPEGTVSGSSQISLSGFSTTDLSEGSNLYYTDARVKTKLNTEGVISSSAQLSDTFLSKVGDNVVSGSAQIKSLLNGDLGGAVTIGDSDDGVIIPGDLTVSGTTTTVNSTIVNIEDNIIVVNYGGAETDAGIYAVDNVSTTGTGSLIWQGDQDFWSAGIKGAEKRVVTFNADNPTNDSFIHLNGNDEVVAIASGSDVGAFLQKTATGFEVSNIIDGGTY